MEPGQRTRHNEPLLFNLARDQGERNDVAAQHPEIVAKLEELMTEHRKQIRLSD